VLSITFGHARTRLADDSVACLDDVSRRTLGLCAFVHDVNFTGVRPSASAAQSIARRAAAFALTSTRGNNSRLQNLLRAGFRK
jgi:hypothetical protein